jgi:hypothetical protein
MNPTPVLVRDPQEDAGPLVDWLRAFARQNDGVVLAEPPVLLYASSLFAEPVHLNEEGAQRFTDEVAQRLQGLEPRASRGGQ